MTRRPQLRKDDIRHVRIHDLRHTYASWLIQAGCPLSEVGKLLGLISAITTQCYDHQAETSSDAVLAALGPAPVASAAPAVVDELAARCEHRAVGVL